MRIVFLSYPRGARHVRLNDGGGVYLSPFDKEKILMDTTLPARGL